MTNIRSWIACAALASALILPQAAALAADEVGYQAIRNHDWATAERVLQEGLQKNPGDMSRQLNLAFVYAQTGRKAEAAALYKEIVKRDQDRVVTLSAHNDTPMSVLAQRGLALLNTK